MTKLLNQYLSSVLMPEEYYEYAKVKDKKSYLKKHLSKQQFKEVNRLME